MTQNKKEQWLKKLDEKWEEGLSDIEQVKSFLSSLIDDINLDWEKRILEAVGEEIKADCSYDSGFNSCRSQILEKLNLKEK